VKSYEDTVSYGKVTIAFKVFFAARKTLEIAVHPDSRVVIKAPLGTSEQEIRKRITEQPSSIRRGVLKPVD
jgi:hypothetical protein